MSGGNNGKGLGIEVKPVVPFVHIEPNQSGQLLLTSNVPMPRAKSMISQMLNEIIQTESKLQMKAQSQIIVAKGRFG